MQDVYKEFMVKREKSKWGTVGKVALIILGVFLYVSISILGLVFAALCLIGAYIIHLMSDVEFEYLYVDKELSIDKIYARSRRKRMATYKLENMEIVAWRGSHRVDAYKHSGKQYKVKDYSSKNAHSKLDQYYIFCKDNEQVIIEADNDFMMAMYHQAPRKVFIKE